ncbi:V-type ATP synthase subunit K [Deinococcus irradiatisoli]|uniref:V-type ATP synthase subunit K n=1 Tax=Deinococcus irradiatisoli TaxID=2202254 RepID=A0A2Z3JKK3_9DEIO|nr:V-type ATP synthase subunit K [Deinococcus irradiatisoli]AWN22448.1 V-type ATP synthase subunit K [Deinococcus irradiatisoli]
MTKTNKIALAALVLALASTGFAQEAATTTATNSNGGLIAVGAGLALGLGAIGTGLAQGRIGAAAAGVTAENPGRLGLMLLWFAIPETLVIFGLVGFFILSGKI